MNEIVDRWSRLVRDVEQGYAQTIDDYTNDLSIRRWPEDARPLLTGEAVEWMDHRLEPLDARFSEATKEAARQLPGVGTEHWWECRIPKVLIGELAQDVANLGLRGDRA